MDAERWAVLRAHVEAALALPPAERSLYAVREVSDPELRAELDELLAFEDEASSILSIDGWDHRAFDSMREDSLEGERLGNYRLIEEIGRGGMGAVYLAERADGTYEQKVAVKVLQESIFTPGLVARFEEERRILARLAHPGIARLLDGGVTPDGRPYLVLEYVAGLSIDRYCAEHELDTDACLRLFLLVAEAVQSAHQQLVLHLDLKPANILINERGEPRLLDFGIARVLAESEGGTLQPEETIRLLTPRYASPEQLRGEPLGVASDVFSLGTLLYRLLTGKAPYPLDDITPIEAARMISTAEPTRPSRACPEQRRRELEGDLDAILLQALRKEPARRYPTVAGLADDVQRYLEKRPVLAHEDSLRYRIRKLFERRRSAVLAVSVAILMLSIATGVAVHYAIKAERARVLAERRLNDVQGIAHSYVYDLDTMLSHVPGTLHARQFALANAKKYLDARYAEAGEDETLAHDVIEGYTEIGRVQATPAEPSLSDPVAAIASKERALAMQRALFRKHPQDLVERRRVVRMLYQDALGYNFAGDVARESALLKEAWELGQPLIEPGTKLWRPLYMATIAWSIAIDYCGNGDEFDFADPLGAVVWLDRSQQLVDQYRAAPTDADDDAMAQRLAERIAISRAVVLLHTNREREAASLFSSLLAQTNKRSEAFQSARIAEKAYLAEVLLKQGDIAQAKAAADLPVQTFVHEATADHHVRREEAEEMILRGRFDLAEGRLHQGMERIKTGLAALEDIYKGLPGNAQMASGLAWITFSIAEETRLSPETRSAHYRRARALAEEFQAKHPEALSAAMLEGQCNLGLGRLASPAERRSLASEAAAQFTKVLAAHPVQPEAQLLLTQAKMMGK